MASSICNKHGEQISTLVSPNVFKAFSEQASIKEVYRVSEVVDGREEWGQSFLAEREELELLGAFAKNSIFEAMLDRYDLFISALNPICSKCVDDWLGVSEIKPETFRLDIED